MKKFYFNLFIVLMLICFSLTACKSSSNNEIEKESNKNSKESSSENSEEKESKESSENSSTNKGETESKEEGNKTSVIKKIKVYADSVGIYSVIIELNENAADKAVIEMIYTGAIGTAEEGSIVNRFRIEYYKDTTGKYEISTFYNGNIDSYYHQKDVIKVENTFGAATRAADVVITYTPDGEQAEEIFKGLASDYQ